MEAPIAGYINEADVEAAAGNTRRIRESEQDDEEVLFDFAEAVRRNLVILPDSVGHLTQHVDYVVDLGVGGRRVSFDEACRVGLIDTRHRRYLDKRRTPPKPITLFEALARNLIVMREELANNYADSSSSDADEEKENRRRRRKRRGKKKKPLAEDIASVFNPATGEQCELSEAVRLGLFDLKRLVYIDNPLVSSAALSSRNGLARVLLLEEACDKGLVILRQQTAASAATSSAGEEKEEENEQQSRSLSRDSYKFLRIKVVEFTKFILSIFFLGKLGKIFFFHFLF